MSEETDRKVRWLEEQVVLLRKEVMRTRYGWKFSLRITGFLLFFIGALILFRIHTGDSGIDGVYQLQGKIMEVLGAWCFGWSFSPWPKL
jgi:hypothetical protein